MCSSLKKWFQGTNFLVYVSHFLSAWGDRMWSFGVGLFLVHMASQSLQLPAVYGLAASITIFFLGALVGDWVDHTPRLTAAQVSLVAQNVLVVVCAGGVYAFLWFRTPLTLSTHAPWLVPLSQGGIILLAVLGRLASLARMIAVERDWIVEICGKDRDQLANMTASLRRIDQATLILAPICTGQIMTYAGLSNGAIFIAAWNVLSVFGEYYLMIRVYSTVPALRAKRSLCRVDEVPVTEAEKGLGTEDEEGATEAVPGPQLSSPSPPSPSPFPSSPASVPGPQVSSPPSPSPSSLASVSDVDPAPLQDSAPPATQDTEDEAEQEPAALTQQDPAGTQGVSDDGRGKGCGVCVGLCSRFLTLYRGWRTYMRYSVALAGIGLACLYMTVLGFDNITVAYAVTQGLSESILGILMGVSAVFGILGTVVYPVLRRRVGLVRCGLTALSCQLACLSLCVLSVWMPGSPFDPLHHPAPACHNTQLSGATDFNTTSLISTLPPAVNSTGNTDSDNSTACESGDDAPSSYISIALLMAGIVLSRFGLWMADLAITQLFLEAVTEGERGVVNGVQSSLNKLMDVLKFLLVVAVPDTHTFGFLILLSFLFICAGWLCYAVFLRRQRGHLFHFHRCLTAACAHKAPVKNGHAGPEISAEESKQASVEEKL